MFLVRSCGLHFATSLDSHRTLSSILLTKAFPPQLTQGLVLPTLSLFKKLSHLLLLLQLVPPPPQPTRTLSHPQQLKSTDRRRNLKFNPLQSIYVKDSCSSHKGMGTGNERRKIYSASHYDDKGERKINFQLSSCSSSPGDFSANFYRATKQTTSRHNFSVAVELKESPFRSIWWKKYLLAKIQLPLDLDFYRNSLFNPPSLSPSIRFQCNSTHESACSPTVLSVRNGRGGRVRTEPLFSYKVVTVTPQWPPKKTETKMTRCSKSHSDDVDDNNNNRDDRRGEEKSFGNFSNESTLQETPS